METSTKKPWQSKTVFFGALTALLGAIAVFVPAAKPAGDWLAAHSGEASMVWGVVAIALRFVTHDRVQLGD